MQSSSLAEPGKALLAALGSNITKPRTLSDVVREIIQLADQADKIVREIAKLKTDAQTAGLLHRASVHCRDLHTAVTVAIASLSPELKTRLGISSTTASP